MNLSAIFAAAGLFAGSLCAEPVFQERFNEVPSAIEFLNGAVQGEAGSGVSGKPEDRAYVAASEPGVENPPPPAGVIHDAPGTELENYTVTVWYKADRELRDPDTLFHFGGLYLLWDKRMGFTMRLQKWVGTGFNGPLLKWDTPNEWIFYAFTWNAESQIATIYQGTSTEPIGLPSERSVPEVTGKNGIGGNCIIGNDWKGKGPHTRPFNGTIDNMRVFNTALSEESIEAVRAADVENKPVPAKL